MLVGWAKRSEPTSDVEFGPVGSALARLSPPYVEDEAVKA